MVKRIGAKSIFTLAGLDKAMARYKPYNRAGDMGPLFFLNKVLRLDNRSCPVLVPLAKGGRHGALAQNPGKGRAGS